MTAALLVVLLLALLAEPLLALVARVAGPRGGGSVPGGTGGRGVVGSADEGRVADVTVVVPLPGDARDLERLDDLHGEGRRVLLVTTAAAGPEFHRRLWEVAGAHGFRVHVVPAAQGVEGRSPRVTLLAGAHQVLTSAYVLCVDPGARLACPPGRVVGELVGAGADVGWSVRRGWRPGASTHDRARAARDHDVASGPLRGVLDVEEALAARAGSRRRWPGPGDVVVARRAVHADLMRRHTGFGLGDDAETAVLAVARGFRTMRQDAGAAAAVGAAATVGAAAAAAAAERASWAASRDAAWGGWWSARVAEAGAAVRLALPRLVLASRRPGALVRAVVLAAVMAPPLWWVVTRVPAEALPGLLAAGLVVHGLLTAVAVRGRAPGRAVVVYPLYALVRLVVLLPLGVLTYLAAVVRSGRVGALRVRDPWWVPDAADAPVVRRLPGPGPARATDWWAPR